MAGPVVVSGFKRCPGGRAPVAIAGCHDAGMFTPVTDRVVVVTGASRGIGLGIARVFAASGARLVITGRDAGRLEEAADELRALDAQVEAVVADVARPEDCQHMADRAVQRFGGIDVLCANAGIYPQAAVATMTPDELVETMTTNLGGTVWSLQACLPALVASGHGRVVVTSSITGTFTGLPGFAHYGASKAAQVGFVRTAALELAPHAVTVNAVLPGNIATEGLAGLGPEYLSQMTAAIPMGRLGAVEDIGHAVLFLATDEARFITGQTLVVDGGQVLPEAGAGAQG